MVRREQAVEPNMANMANPAENVKARIHWRGRILFG